MIRKLIQCCRPSWFVRYSAYYCQFAMELLSVLLNSMYLVIVGPSLLISHTGGEKSRDVGLWNRRHSWQDLPKLFSISRGQWYSFWNGAPGLGAQVVRPYIVFCCIGAQHILEIFFWFCWFALLPHGDVISIRRVSENNISRFQERFFFVSGIGQRPATM